MLEISATQIKIDGSQQYTFSIFSMLNYVAPMFISHMLLTLDGNLIIFRVISMFLCLGLVSSGYWGGGYKSDIYPLYWYITLWFCLPVLSSYTVFLTYGDQAWLLNAVLSMLLLLMLASWRVFMILTTMGISISYMIFSLQDITAPIHLPSNNIHLFGYLCAFLLLAVLLFMRRKEDMQDKKIEVLKLFGGAIAHEVNSPLAASRMLATTYSDLAGIVQNSAEKIEESNGEIYYRIVLAAFDYEMLTKSLPDGFKRSSQEAAKVVEILLLSLRDKFVNPDTEYSMAEVVREAVSEHDFTPQQSSKIYYDLKENFLFKGSKQLIKNVLHNLFRNAIKHGGENASIAIRLEKNKLYLRDNGKGIAKNELKKIFNAFYTSSDTGYGIGLSFCRTVMKSMRSTIECKSELGKYTEFILTFPSVSE